MKSSERKLVSKLNRSADEDAIEQAVAAPELAPPSRQPFPKQERKFHFTPTGVSIAPAGRLGSWHLPVGQTLSSTCEILNRREVNYVVLPSAIGERLALLFADDDASRIGGLITRIPFGQPLPVYATTDLPGFSFQQHWRQINDATNMAILPSHLAERLLARARVDNYGFRVPATEDLLFWVIYRALYLTGDRYFDARSNEEAPILLGPQTRIISDLTHETGANLREPLTLEALNQHLSQAGWEPPFEVLRRISCWNGWAALKVQERGANRVVEGPGIVAFFVRRAVADHGMEADIAGMIASCGFEVLKTIELNQAQSEAATRTMRGGNWGPGASPVGGGPPARIFVALDVAPAPVKGEMRQKYPHMDNAHILEAKLRCREFIRDKLPRNRSFNPVHSTDDSAHTWEVVRMFAADEEPALRRIIESRKASFATQFEVVRSLTRTGQRSKIEVIRFRGGLAVKKTFRHNCLRFMEREAAFMDAISPHRPEILPVLERGPNYFIMPYIKGRPLRRSVFGRGFPMLLTMRQVREVADLLRFLLSRGYDPVDLGPHNLLVDQFGQLTAIDFEFVHQSDAPIDPEQAACLNGVAKGFEGEWPPKAIWASQRAKCLDPWSLRWFACTGLTLRSFLHDPPSLQRIKRLVNYPTYIVSKLMERQSVWVRERAKHVLRRRLPAVARMAASALRARRA